mgnify:FL=1
MFLKNIFVILFKFKLQMTKNYLLILLLLLSSITYLSCSEDGDDTYENIAPVEVDLTQVPYEKLSDYNFFDGDLKNQIPALGVLPYSPISSLFTDYASKKRFVWMPKNTKATYNGAGEILELPVGSAIIKTFYYANVQPNNTTKIIETRIMIKKATGWIFAEYVWNEEQTDAFLDMNGSTTTIDWIKNGEPISINYRIPSEAECFICHKENNVAVPIGIKPQSLNATYTYATGSMNQLQKWINIGYLENNLPANITTVVDYSDTSQNLELRVRSYLDINCAHCHKEGSHCDYRPIRLAFDETTTPSNLGICIAPEENINSALTNIITPNNFNRSVMHFRMNTTDEATRMPLIGRNLIHTEGVQLIEDWINTLTPCN